MTDSTEQTDEVEITVRVKWRRKRKKGDKEEKKGFYQNKKVKD